MESQVFAQQMMENLINDLLDLAKIENHVFSFS
jgi:signal transduction histidine kinase